MSEVTHVSDGATGAFVIERDGARLATLSYSMAGAVMTLEHTAVDDALRGTGAGGKLVDAAVSRARAERLQIVPACTYAKSVFDKTPAYHDVLAP